MLEVLHDVDQVRMSCRDSGRAERVGHSCFSADRFRHVGSGCAGMGAAHWAASLWGRIL